MSVQELQTPLLRVDCTREEAAHRAHLRAVERVRKLQSEMVATFDEMLAAQESMRDAGVSVEVVLSSYLQVAFREYRVATGQAGELRVAR